MLTTDSAVSHFVTFKQPSGGAGSNGLPMLDDIVRATEMVNRVRSDQVAAQLTASKGLLSPTDAVTDVCPRLSSAQRLGQRTHAERACLDVRW